MPISSPQLRVFCPTTLLLPIPGLIVAGAVCPRHRTAITGPQHQETVSLEQQAEIILLLDFCTPLSTPILAWHAPALGQFTALSSNVL